MGKNSAFYSQTILSILHKLHGLQLWMQVPIVPHEADFLLRDQVPAETSEPVAAKVIPGMASTSTTVSSSASPASKELAAARTKSAKDVIVAPSDEASKSWELWNRFRLACHHHHKLSVALELTEHMPSELEQARWIAEPIKAVIIPTRVFITNSKGAPVLSAAHVAFLHRIFRHDIQIIITGNAIHGQPANRSIYQQYITHVFSKTPTFTKTEQFLQPFHDFIQDPLQPLMDNLESATYEVFEKDPVKYKQYEDAIYQAILDLSPKKIAASKQATSTESGTTTGSSANTSGQLVVMIVGAGRGGIVESAMRAEARAKINIKLYALDKNPNALVAMRSKQLVNQRWKEVTIVHQDMRDWNAPEFADILVSEMLGSFGDNELSPECLQGAERLIEPNHGVSIPAWYTSYLAPVSTCKLWNELSVQYEAQKVYETPYVVRLHNFFELAEPKPAFTFTHPSPPPFNNTRCITIEFESPTSTLVHGFSGYFDCCLYKNVHMSIEPRSHTKDMVSWFPIWFPLRKPLTVKKGTPITVNLWRCTGAGKVWYEWNMATDLETTAIHNAGGRSCAIGL